MWAAMDMQAHVSMNEEALVDVVTRVVCPSSLKGHHVCRI